MSKLTLVFIAASLIYCGSIFAATPETTPDSPIPNLIIVVHGHCTKFMVDGKDLSGQCSNQLMQSVWNSGRVGFYVVSNKDDGYTVTFSGFDGAKPDKDTQIENLDKVLINSKAANFKPEVKKVTGTCVYKNPYLGPNDVICKAVDDAQKTYELQFRTDGKEPEFIKMKQ